MPTGRVERICVLVGVLLIGSGLAHLVVFAVDGGPWSGPVSWRKPATFGLSFGLTLITMVWVSGYLPLGDRLRRVLHGVLVLPALAWLLSLTDWPESRRTRLVAVGVAGYGLAIAAALAWSLA